LWLLDYYFTGASSMAIVTACRRELLTTTDQLGAFVPEEGHYQVQREDSLTVIQEWLLWNIPSAACISLFLLFSYTLPMELWYWLPVGLAAIAVSLQMLLEYIRDGFRIWYHGVVFAAFFMGVEGIILDAVFCRNEMQGRRYLADTFMMGNTTFFACNVAFGALLWKVWTESKRDEQRDNLDKKTQ